MCVQEAGKGKEYQALLEEIEGAGLEGGALDQACNELQALVSALKPPKQLCKEVGQSRLLQHVPGCSQETACAVAQYPT